MRRPLSWCFVGWIVGESISYIFGVKSAICIALSLLAGSIALLLFILLITRKKEKLIRLRRGNSFPWATKKWKVNRQNATGRKCATRRQGEIKQANADGTSFFQRDDGKIWKTVCKGLFLFYMFWIVAGIRFFYETNIPSFYDTAKKQTKISLTIHGTITEQTKSTSGTALILDDVTVLKNGKKQELPTKVVMYEAQCDYQIGQKIEAVGSFSLQKEPTSPGQFNSYLYYRAKGIYGSFLCERVVRVYGTYSPIRELARRIRSNLDDVYHELFSEEEAGVISAMIVGEKSGLSDDIKTLYQENGISHILAISGLHISFLGRNLYKKLRKYRCSFFISALLSASLLLFYGYIVGFSHSAFRAIVMLCLTFVADVIGRSYDMVTAIYACALLILIKRPFCLFDTGTLLSFGAVLGIGLLLPILEATFAKSEEGDRDIRQTKQQKSIKTCIIQQVRQSLLSSISIQLVTIPILLQSYYELPTYGMLLNLIVIPLLSYLLPLAILAGIAGSMFIPAGKVVAFFASLLLQLYKILAQICVALPFHKWTIGHINEIQIVFYIVGVAVVLFFLYSRKRGQKKWTRNVAIVLYSVALSCFLCVGAIQNKNEIKIVMLDVGQGDGLLFQLPDKTTCLLDGGSSSKQKIGTYVIRPALKYYGIASIDYVFVSHEDSDHISGIVELFENNYPIKHLILPYREKQEKEENYEKLVALAKKTKTNVSYIKKGDEMKRGGVTFTCLHPKQTGQEGETNADSMVLSLQYHSFRALFTGDLADGGEEQLVSYLQEMSRADKKVLEGKENTPSGQTSYTMLKVAHHGSKKSTFEPLLELVKPNISLISCSATNSYGHPGKETLQRLTDAGSEIFITKDVGAMEFHIAKDGKIRGILFRK